MPEIYIYNGTTKSIDLTASMYDVMTQRQAVVPPGAQGYFQSQDQVDIDATIAQLTRYGAIPQANPQPSFMGVSHSATSSTVPNAAQVVIAATPAVVPRVVVVRPPAKPPLSQFPKK
jgi:hypothetical protein